MTKLPSVNGLRAIGVIIIILSQLLKYNLFVDMQYLNRIPFLNMRFGLNVLFIIWGFLITSSLIIEEKANGRVSIKDFYIRRLLRIFPVYYYLLFVYFLISRLNVFIIPRSSWLTSLTFTKYLNYREEFYTGHLWPLSIAVSFLWVWPLIFTLGAKARKFASLSLVVLIPLATFYSNLKYYPSELATWPFIFEGFDSLALGCWIALFKEPLIERLTPHWRNAFIVSLGAIFLFPWFSLFSERTPLHALFLTFGNLKGPFANAVIVIFVLYSIYGPRKKWHKILNSKALNYIGLFSYSLCLWQQIYILKNQYWVAIFPQNIICIFLTAMFSYFLLERPLSHLKSRFSNRKSSALGIRNNQATTPN